MAKNLKQFTEPSANFGFMGIGDFLLEIMQGNVPIDQWSDPTYLHPGLGAMYGDAIERGITNINKYLARRSMRTKIVTVAIDQDLTNEQKYDLAALLLDNGLIPGTHTELTTVEDFQFYHEGALFIKKENIPYLELYMNTAETVILAEDLEMWGLSLPELFERKSGDYMQSIGSEGVLNPFYYGKMNTLVVFTNRIGLDVHESDALRYNGSLGRTFVCRSHSLITIVPARAGNTVALWKCSPHEMSESKCDHPFQQVDLPFDQVVRLKEICNRNLKSAPHG